MYVCMYVSIYYHEQSTHDVGITACYPGDVNPDGAFSVTGYGIHRMFANYPLHVRVYPLVKGERLTTKLTGK